MQNIHARAWDQGRHPQARSPQETDIARGFRIDLDIRYGAFIADAEPFEHVVVFGLKAGLTGSWVPDDWIADFCARDQKLVGFASCDPTQPGYSDEVIEAILARDALSLLGIKV